MQWQIRNSNKISISLQIDDVFLLGLINNVQHPVVKNFLVWKDTELDEDVQRVWLSELHRIMEANRFDARRHYLKGNKLPKDPQLREYILSELVDRYLDKHHQDWFLIKDLEALLELALSTKSLIHCVSN
ncbi:hypothetical protein K9N68_39290 (plasmid) [Kovacikia minuta CCNUW1]|uniref:hypothetical protein n=1 Tax=Kovacikia minuta TaxID=2931930 RepID=UPI001CC9C71C|nr:hypothetical protein [Kovacikia minuta]UBF30183.1 hypothetical protein K9N68_39290 [Kovacikia minuta CCNUW1]